MKHKFPKHVFFVFVRSMMMVEHILKRSYRFPTTCVIFILVIFNQKPIRVETCNSPLCAGKQASEYSIC